MPPFGWLSCVVQTDTRTGDKICLNLRYCRRWDREEYSWESQYTRWKGEN